MEKKINNFQELLCNIFKPLFEATADTLKHKNNTLHQFLEHVSAFDSVDDESPREIENLLKQDLPTPDAWNHNYTPPYSYFLFYLFSNIAVLNLFRRDRSCNTFKLRPHCGEAGNVNHLVAGFFLAENIAHGIKFEEEPVLQYLAYLSQMGLSMSPLSNNALFQKYHNHTFPDFFKRGLNVTLSTDDPLIFHSSEDPLLEEYSTAAQMWGLSSVDLCEIVRNGFYQSGLLHSEKEKILGKQYLKIGPGGNDIEKSNLSSTRVYFRYTTWLHEFLVLLHFARYHDDTAYKKWIEQIMQSISEEPMDLSSVRD